MLQQCRKEKLKRTKNVYVIPALIDKDELILNEKAIIYLNELLGDTK